MYSHSLVAEIYIALLNKTDNLWYCRSD